MYIEAYVLSVFPLKNHTHDIVSIQCNRYNAVFKCRIDSNSNSLSILKVTELLDQINICHHDLPYRIVVWMSDDAAKVGN